MSLDVRPRGSARPTPRKGHHNSLPRTSLEGALRMGWVAVIAAPALFQAMPPGGMAWVLGGGLVYSAGALVYGLRRPNLVPGVFGFTSCGTSSSWQEAPAISGRCCTTSRSLPKGSGVIAGHLMPDTSNMCAGLCR